MNLICRERSEAPASQLETGTQRGARSLPITPGTVVPLLGTPGEGLGASFLLPTTRVMLPSSVYPLSHSYFEQQVTGRKD